MPPPDILAGYAAINEMFPERIMRMAEKAAEHSQTLQLTALSMQGDNQRDAFTILKRGQWFGILAVSLATAAGLYVVRCGHPGAGASMFCSVVVGLAGVYVIGRKLGPGGEPF